MKTGKWSDFATGEKGGDPISLVAANKNTSQLDAARILAELIGYPIKALEVRHQRSIAWKKQHSLSSKSPILHRHHRNRKKKSDFWDWAKKGDKEVIKKYFANRANHNGPGTGLFPIKFIQGQEIRANR